MAMSFCRPTVVGLLTSSCSISARLETLPRHSTTLADRASGRVGERARVRFPQTRIAPGRYRFTLSLSAPVYRGEPRVLASKPLMVRCDRSAATARGNLIGGTIA
jgi:hypothetical protein